MNKNILLLSTLLSLLVLPQQSAYATRTPSFSLTAQAEETKKVTTNGGNLSTSIDVCTGTLSADLSPGFLITTNSCEKKYLSLTIKANTQSGMKNAVFSNGSLHYVILTNSDVIPNESSITNIRNGQPTAEQNPNAIAYVINDPPKQKGILENQYISPGDYWQFRLSKKGPVSTSITIPASKPLSETYSFDDEAGKYQAVVTLSFN